MDANGQPLVTSLFDWEIGCIVPAILSDPVMVVFVSLVIDKNASPSIACLPDDASPDDCAQYMKWSRKYFKVRPSFQHHLYQLSKQRNNHFSVQVLFDQAPEFEPAIQAGKDARHLWFALRDWRGENPEGYFGDLGAWAESRMKELGVD